ncbi:MAG: DUF4080 domain-containing protein [Planctomycetota bacterium]|nr:MAG: DUF4080 domain-containing protein [Planctomycetota bacterium]
MAAIILTTLNARWSHASMGLRCLRANLGHLREQSCIREFTINDPCMRIVEDLLAENPRIIGMGVYIWNLRESERVVAALKALRPDIVVVCGGPEVSHGTEHTRLDVLADCIVSGEGDEVFATICRAVLDGGLPPRRVSAPSPDLASIALPYAEYSNEDLSKRIIYVEASRGCPFTCEFCLSSIDEAVRTVPLERFLAAMDDLIHRGCRTFKFVDRTFNLKPSSCQQILDFFHERWPRDAHGDLLSPLTTRQMDANAERGQAFFLHFEMVPDRLPEAIKSNIERFPAGAIQFEVGIQSFTPEVGKLISRRMHPGRTAENLRYLRDSGLVHVHADLIVGLPGETLETFLDSYDQLHELGPEEIQVGILKLLRGTPLARHIPDFAMVFNPEPPYDLLASRDFPFASMQRMKRFARYHDVFVNSGRFPHTMACITQQGASPARSLLTFSDWLWQSTGQEHQFALTRQYDLLLDYLLHCGVTHTTALDTLCQDALTRESKRGIPERLRPIVEAAWHNRPTLPQAVQPPSPSTAANSTTKQPVTNAMDIAHASD